jgi:hypothetical protein
MVEVAVEVVEAVEEAQVVPEQTVDYPLLITT